MSNNPLSVQLTVEDLSQDEKDTYVALKETSPSKVSKHITPNLIRKMQGCASDPVMRKAIIDNIVSYSSILSQGRFKMEDYMRATKFCTYCAIGNNNKEAYIKTFPDKWQKWVTEGLDENTKNVYISAYARGKLVRLILDHIMMPTWLLNADKTQLAINRLAEIATKGKSEIAVVNACNSLLTNLKRPEAAQVEVNVTTNDGKSEIESLHETIKQLSGIQLQNIQTGATSLKEVAESKIIEGECEDVEPSKD